jgi:hypothetical protein
MAMRCVKSYAPEICGLGFQWGSAQLCSIARLYKLALAIRMFSKLLEGCWVKLMRSAVDLSAEGGNDNECLRWAVPACDQIKVCNALRFSLACLRWLRRCVRAVAPACALTLRAANMWLQELQQRKQCLLCKLLQQKNYIM